MSIWLILRLMIAFSSMMAEAALFVYRPKKFKALPYVVLAAMMLIYFIGPFDLTLGPTYLFVHDIMPVVWIPTIVYYDKWFMFITILPVVTLLVLMIVKKNQEKKEDEMAS